MLEIKLSAGFATVIDDIDSDLADECWYAQKDKRTHYAVRNSPRRRTQKTSVKIRLHRVVAERIGSVDGMFVDHVDGNGLNNVRSNIRIVTRCQNGWNRRKSENSASRFKGVFADRRSGKWRSEIMVLGIRINLGYFSVESIAAMAYDEAARKHHGEFARLNFGPVSRILGAAARMSRESAGRGGPETALPEAGTPSKERPGYRGMTKA